MTDEPNANATSDQSQAQDSASTSVPGQPYILIAEDAMFYAKVDQAKFQSAGFEVMTVSNGQELLDSARQRKPDIIILDLIMPVKDGFATTQELKADPSLKDIPVLVFSNLSQQSDIDKLKQLGADDFLIKNDNSPTALVDKVKAHLAQSKL
jgi:CheY-like chemotaxis protein